MSTTPDDLKNLTPEWVKLLDWRKEWLEKAHPYQLTPNGDAWDIWMLLAGRGSGKTFCASNELGWMALTDPESRSLVAAPTSSDIRDTCFEGDSGLLNVLPSWTIKEYNKSLHELILFNDALIKGIPGGEPERFRGPQFHRAWCLIPGTLITTPKEHTPIELLRAGDFVCTRFGPRKVLSASRSANPNPLVKISLGLTSLTGTEDHPILTERGWVSLGQLQIGDRICQASISITLAERVRTALFTKSISGLSQKGLSFITRMKIKATTILRIWLPCLNLNTADSMLRERVIPKNKSNCLRSVLRSASRSIPVKLESARNATLNLFRIASPMSVSFARQSVWRNGARLTSNLRHDAVYSAIAGISLYDRRNGSALVGVTSTQRKSAIAEAQTNGKILGARIAKLFSSLTGSMRGSVQERALSLSMREIKNVEKFPNSTTYNITVQGAHEYIANGIVVHNCDELAAFQYPQTAWDLMTLGIRLGARTKILVTTTPKPIPLLRDLMRKEGKGVVVSRASTYDNLKNLASNFKDQVLRFEGTQIGRQEVYGELLDLAESGILKKSWFRLYPAKTELPYFETILISLDTAMTVNTHSDFTACTVWGVFKWTNPETNKTTTNALLLDCWAEKLTYPDLRDRVKQAWLCHYGGANGGKGQLPSTFLIEDKGSGISLRQDLQSEMIPVAAFNPGHADKVQRANLAAPILKDGFIWLPESEKRPGEFKNWIDPLMDELTIFPNDDAHDDYVDSCVQSWHYLYSAGHLHAPLAAERDEDLVEQEFDYAKKRRNVLNPYAQ